MMRKLIILLTLILCSGVVDAQADLYPGIWKSSDNKSHLILYAGVAIILKDEKIQSSGPIQYVFFKKKPHQLSVKWEDKEWVTYLIRFPSDDILELQANDADPTIPPKEFSSPDRFTRVQ